MRHPKYKTEVCKKFSNTGNCPYGNRCRFIHEGINDDSEDNAPWSSSWTPTGAQSAVPASPPDSPEKKQQQLQNKADDARRLAIFERIANT